MLSWQDDLEPRVALAQTDGSVMATMSEFKDLFGEWIATVARAVDTVAGRFLRSRQILLRRRQGRHGGGQGDLGAKTRRRCLRCRFVWTRAGRTPPLPADWKTAFRGSRVEASAAIRSRHVLAARLSKPGRRFSRWHDPRTGRPSDALDRQRRHFRMEPARRIRRTTGSK